MCLVTPPPPPYWLATKFKMCWISAAAESLPVENHSLFMSCYDSSRQRLLFQSLMIVLQSFPFSTWHTTTLFHSVAQHAAVGSRYRRTVEPPCTFVSRWAFLTCTLTTNGFKFSTTSSQHSPSAIIIHQSESSIGHHHHHTSVISWDVVGFFARLIEERFHLK